LCFVDTATWVAHQAPYNPNNPNISSTPQIESVGSHIAPAPKLEPVDSQDFLLDDLPSPAIASLPNSRNSVHKSGEADEKKMAKREKNRHTEQAAAELYGVLEESEEILRALLQVDVHEEMDRILNRIQELYTRYRSITRRTFSLDQIRNRIQPNIGLIESRSVEVRAGLGLRKNAIAIEYSG
jgi:hypothetical protein